MLMDLVWIIKVERMREHSNIFDTKNRILEITTTPYELGQDCG